MRGTGIINAMFHDGMRRKAMECTSLECAEIEWNGLEGTKETEMEYQCDRTECNTMTCIET